MPQSSCGGFVLFLIKGQGMERGEGRPTSEDRKGGEGERGVG